MKSLITFFFLVFCFTGFSQDEKILLKNIPVTDYSNLPVYSNLVDSVEGKIGWKERYSYLDKINISWITYMSDGLMVKGLLVQPKEVGTYPCIIFNRGGNRDFGSLKTAHGIYLLGKLAAEGYVVIASQYRGNGGGEGLEEFGGKDVNDVIRLIDVLSELESADTNRIGMYGWSRGGMMTYLAMCQTDKIKAVVTGGAVSDLVSTIEDRPEMETNVTAELIPNYLENKNEELEKRSAVYWVDKFPKDVPILLLHGNSDWRVKCSQSLELALEMDKYRIPYKLIVFEGGDHELNEFDYEVDREVLTWFDRFVKNGESLPNMDFHGN